MLTRRKFLASLIGLPFAAKIAQAVADHAELVARVDKSIIDQTKARIYEMRAKTWAVDFDKCAAVIPRNHESMYFEAYDSRYEYRAHATKDICFAACGALTLDQIFGALYRLKLACEHSGKSMPDMIYLRLET